MVRNDLRNDASEVANESQECNRDGACGLAGMQSRPKGNPCCFFIQDADRKSGSCIYSFLNDTGSGPRWFCEHRDAGKFFCTSY